MIDPSEEIRRRLAAPPPPTEDIVSDFLQAIWVDSGGGGSVDAELQRLAADDRGLHYLRRGADAIDELLANPPAEHRLWQLVSIDAERPLPMNTDEVAAEWLRTFVARVRAVVERT
jgi:hypothetical protein